MEGSRYILPGIGDPEGRPAPEFVDCALIFSRSALAGGPGNIVSPGSETACGGPGDEICRRS